jgi:hypothetical protein
MKIWNDIALELNWFQIYLKIDEMQIGVESIEFLFMRYSE